MKDKTCVIIAGPTAVGKTALSIELAQYYSTSIISADSRQCFNELNIGVAKPSLLQLNSVPHYFINSYSVTEDISANVFEKYALRKIEEIFKNNDVAIVVGGTGLYIKAFAEGLDNIPSPDPVIVTHLNDDFNLYGIDWLQEKIKQLDPDFALKGEIKNPHRCLRALAVMLSSGKSILSFHSGMRKKRDFNLIKIGLELPRELLVNNINYRIDNMINDGLVNEVYSLIPYASLKSLQTVGYQEIFEYIKGNCTLSDAVEKIKINTRHYAKRQMTWFKKDTDTKWIDSRSSFESILNWID